MLLWGMLRAWKRPTRLAWRGDGSAAPLGCIVACIAVLVALGFGPRALGGTGQAAAAGGSAVCDRTPAVRDAIVAAVPGVHECVEVTDAHLAAITGTLDLQDKGITALKSGDFAGLTAVTRLRLDDNALETLPADIFANLTALRSVRLTSNSLATLPAGVFAGLANLEILDLEYNVLAELPPRVFAGLDLEFLGLESNQLTTLEAGGESMFAGLRVRTLDLSHNQVRVLRPNVFDGTDLWHPDLGENQLCELPAELFRGLGGLEHLWLDENPGADFTFTMAVTQVPNTHSVVVSVAEGAPFTMTTTVSVTGGTLPTGVHSVTVPVGHTTSGEIVITPREGESATVSLGVAPPLPVSGAIRTSYYGIATAVGTPLTLAAPGATDDALVVIGRSTIARSWKCMGPLAEYTAVDPVGNAVTWSLSGPDGGEFDISGGVLSFLTPPDFDSPTDTDGDNVYQVTVEASDGTNVGALDVSVRVTGINKPPVVSGDPAVNYPEGGNEPRVHLHRPRRGGHAHQLVAVRS